MARPVQSYREDSNDSADSDFTAVDSEDDPADPIQTQPIQPISLPSRLKRRHARKRKRPVTRSFDLFKKRKPNTGPVSRKKTHIPKKPSSDISLKASSGRIPPWQTIPYHVLFCIMKFAAYPLYEQASRATPYINWLADTSRLCKAFHEACCAALLLSPPLYPSFRAHGLMQLLEKDTTKTITNYRNLIKCLDIEVKNLLVKKSGINLEQLISRTPLLKSLRLYHNHDDLTTQVWAQPSAAKGRKWAYPENLASMLDRHNVKLTSFEWNGRFASPLEALNTMKAAHPYPCFQDLQDVTFLNMTYPEKHTEVDVQLLSSLLLAGLDHLSAVRSLTLRNCDMLTDTVMSRLPPNLTRLEITSCSFPTSENLSSYLRQQGSSLTTLRLIGNQTMSLGFIPNLKDFCPRLQTLYIDLTYVDPTSYRDREPLYDELLPNGQPTWPSTLVSIDLEYLRKFSAANAEGFFTSLVDAAPELTGLRRLNIKAIIKAEWRDRAAMRKKWIPKMTNVFLNTDEPNKSSLPRRPRIAKSTKDDAESETAGRRSGRIKQIQTRKDEESEESDASSAGSSFSDGTTSDRKQGTCSVVELSLSDQRPSQEQYNENDFLDDELSGDGDFRA